MNGLGTMSTRRTRRLGPVWMECTRASWRFGLGSRAVVLVQNLRHEPWSPGFSVRNGRGGLTLIWGRWMVRT